MNQKLNSHVSMGVVSTQHGFVMRKMIVLMEAMSKTVLAMWDNINVLMVTAYRRIFGAITFPIVQIIVMKSMVACAILILNMTVKVEDVLTLAGSVMERRTALTEVMRMDVMPQQCSPQQQVREHGRHGLGRGIAKGEGRGKGENRGKLGRSMRTEKAGHALECGSDLNNDLGVELKSRTSQHEYFAFRDRYVHQRSKSW